MLKKVLERNWEVKFDIAKEWEAIDFPEGVDQLVKKIRSYEGEVIAKQGKNIWSVIEPILNKLESAKTVKQFDAHWNHLYDIADEVGIWVVIW